MWSGNPLTVRTSRACACLVGLCVLAFTVPAVFAQDETRSGAGSAQQERPPVYRYEYGFDPYTLSPHPRGYASQGYSKYGYNLFLAPYTPPSTPRRVQRPADQNNQVYGYVGEDDEEVSTPRSSLPLGDDFLYFYDESGTLRYGPQYEAEHDSSGGPVHLQRRVETETPREPEAAREPAAVPEPRVRQFEGEVIDVHTVTGRTDNRVHWMVRIRQPNDTFESVEVGPIGLTQLRKGDWIDGVGTPGFLRDQPTILARRIAVNGRRQYLPEAPVREPRNYFGEVVSTRGIYLENTPERQGVAEIRDRSGAVYSVLLGPTTVLSTTALRPGTQVEVWGREGTLDGLPVVIAEQFEFGDRVLRVYYDRDRYDTQIP